MTSVRCPSCGAQLLALSGHAGIDAHCPTCGAVVAVPAAPAGRYAEADAATARGDVAATGPHARDPAPAAGGDVPAPRASGSGTDFQIPLALAAASIACPLLGPIAWWLVHRAAQPIRERGEDVPVTARHARLLAMTGTVLLVLMAVCCAPTLLVIG